MEANIFIKRDYYSYASDHAHPQVIIIQIPYNTPPYMSLSIFGAKNLYYKNGIWWFTKLINNMVGEERYDRLRIARRVASNKFYYSRQQLLYQCFVECPDLACLLGIYPKVDSSHGFGFNNTYEMYRDFQENTINSDGSFGMWIVYIAAIYLVHEWYNYMGPWYWNKTGPKKNGEEEMYRMKDAVASTIMEESYGFQYVEWGFMPHDVHFLRSRLTQGLSHPDDVRAMHMSTLNRKNRYREHYLDKVGDSQRSMLYRWSV